jgi:N4-gp56 family major capsid protein
MHVEDNVVKEATDILGDQAGLTLDTVWRDAVVPNMANATILVVAGTVTTEASLIAADIITAKALDVSILTLKKNLAKKFTGIISGSVKVGTEPVRAAYMSIIHPDVVYDLEGITGYKNVSEYASLGDVQEGEVGSYRDIRFIETTQGYINVDGGAAAVDTYHTPIFGKEGYGVVSLRGKKKFDVYVKSLGSSGTADPIDQRSTVGWKASTVAKILNDAFAVSVISASSVGANT